MSTSTINKSNIASKVWFDENKMSLLLNDGREISVPIEWFPRLRDASPAQRNNWRFIGNGEGIHWPDIDEDILVEALM